MLRSQERSVLFLLLVVLSLVAPTSVFAGTCWNGGFSGSAPWAVKTSGGADSCAYADVNYCVNTVAAAGDTVNVPAGTCTWGSRITISKAVTIIGAGIGRTIINNSYTRPGGGSFDPAQSLISIVPASPATNPVIRISGFTFNFGSSSYGIYYQNTSTTYDCTNVRLDHLDISASGFVFQRYGLAHGVMDNCTIKGKMDAGGSATLWTTNGWEFGTASNFYIEDCTWGPYSNTSEIYHAGNGAHRYAFRHNTITIPTGVQISPLFDQHGNQSSAASAFGAEIYENTISTSGNSWQTYFFDQRGGKSLVYNNAVTWTSGGGVATGVREEHQDSDGPGPATNPINGQPQHVSDTYYWGNRKNGAIFNPAPTSTLIDVLSGRVVPAANQDFWVEVSSFDGTSGVGTGTLASRPATCTTGVGYWATDEKRLYRCAATNTWTLYYTPYPYPHPLRRDASSPAPSPPSLKAL